ncbi:LysM peptidoglycan-binding domain-containing protein [Vogesella sp. LIG4]|uniref:LysM peptidoglycan-binding domain-containing protein n=1 Tax=Vogesella sp. LIG4 TaxID=1192162 RepID=UPI000B5AFC11|nr:LysM peptidoglycan-binding domain-containing protein [Vogesella sp. LIG4]
MFKPIISLVLAVGLSAPALADTLQLRADAPQRYVVKKGDTLWDISGKYLKSPWKWPQLWRMNREEIKNPHWIYPGDVLYLEYVNGRPVLRIGSNRTVKLSPQVRSTQLDEAITMIPAKVIEPFLKRPLLVDDEAAYEKSPRIVATQENRVILSTMDPAYATGITSGGTWQAYRLGRPVIDPDTKEVLGREAVYGGDLQVRKLAEVSTLEVANVEEEILIGDHLAHKNEKEVQQYIPHEPPAELKGKIVQSVSGVNEIGQLYSVVINRGQREGVEVGHVFGIYRAPKIVSVENEGKKQDLAMPTEKIGNMIVYRVFQKASYALVMNTSQPVFVGDKVAAPE